MEGCNFKYDIIPLILHKLSLATYVDNSAVRLCYFLILSMMLHSYQSLVLHQVALHLYLHRTVMLKAATYLPLMPARIGTW